MSTLRAATDLVPGNIIENPRRNIPTNIKDGSRHHKRTGTNKPNPNPEGNEGETQMSSERSTDPELHRRKTIEQRPRTSSRPLQGQRTRRWNNELKTGRGRPQKTYQLANYGNSRTRPTKHDKIVTNTHKFNQIRTNPSKLHPKLALKQTEIINEASGITK